jgi:hypothetical protein
MIKALLTGFILIAIGAVSMDSAQAHHVLGRPAYNLGIDSNTPSSQQAELQIGDYMVTYMVFPAFPQPGTPGRISLYVKRLDNDDTFDGKVSFMIRDDVMVPALQNVREELVGIQVLDHNKVYRQSFQFSETGDYIVSARFDAGGEPYIIDFPLRVGDVSPISPLVIAGGVVLIVLVVVSVTQRRRAMTGKIRGERDGPDDA